MKPLRPLLQRFGVPRDGALIVHSAIASLSRHGFRADDMIEELLDYMAEGNVFMPTMTWRTVTQAQPKWDEIATPSHTGNIDWDFWEVDKGKPGTKWEGYTFVSRVRGGHEPEPVRGREAYIALQEILKIGVAQAAQNYGRLMRECGFCHISLTKRESRYNGYGAQCAENHDLPYVTPPADWEDPGEAS